MLCQSKIKIRIIVLFALILCYSNAAQEEFIDLGHNLSPDAPFFKYSILIPFRFTFKIADFLPSGHWFAHNNIELSEHTGTQIDAPYHYNQCGWKVDEIPLHRLVAPAVVMDISEKVKTDPLYSMTATDVTDWISQNGAFPNNSIVLIYTGWSNRYPDPTLYFGHPNDLAQSKYPSVGIEALEAMLSNAKRNNREISGLGIDTATPDYLPTDAVHIVTARENMFIIENLNKNLALLPPVGAQLWVMPVKIKGGTGAPSRVIAILPKCRKPRKCSCRCNLGAENLENAGAGAENLENAGAENLENAGAGAENLENAGAGAENLENAGAENLENAGAGAENLENAGAGAENLENAVAGAENLENAGAGAENLENAGADAENLENAVAGAENLENAGAGATYLQKIKRKEMLRINNSRKSKLL
ncbi:UNVERIFIED_CONTAM: hypothetical protein RMT77_011275 [Armadillidium vulgare]